MDIPMPSLNWPSAPFAHPATRQGQTGSAVFGQKEWVVLEPEEWVRQHVIHHLNDQLGYPLGCMSVEHQLTLNGMPRRADIVAFTPDGAPQLLVECKAPNVRSTKTRSTKPPGTTWS